MPITGRKLISGEGLGLISGEGLGLTRGSLQYSDSVEGLSGVNGPKFNHQPSKMLITINSRKDSRDFNPHYFS